MNHFSRHYRYSCWLALVLTVLLSGCFPFLPHPDEGPQALQSVPPDATSTPEATTAPLPSALPTNTPTPTQPPPPIITPTPTPTLHPMNIAAMRQTPYPGSEIVIEEELEPGANYSRYIASYQSDGLKIYGLLTIPDGETPRVGWPAIVFNHGYIPPEQYRTTERYVAYVDWLARSEYIVFRIDYRGHDRSEGEAHGAYGYPGYTVDVLNAVAALKQFDAADSERIGMWGHSMGGYLTLRSMVISPDIKAGVIWAGVVASYPDLLARWHRERSFTPTPGTAMSRSWRAGWVEEFGTPEENPDFWNAISSNSYLGEISGPVQLHHGTADESVPPIFSEILYEQLAQAGKIAELYIYEGDNHNLSNGFRQAMTRTIQFFDTYLKEAP